MDVLTTQFRESLIRAVYQDPSFLLDRRACLSVGLFQTDEEKALVSIATDHFDKFGTKPDEMVLTSTLEQFGWEVEDIDDVVNTYITKPVSQIAFLKDKTLEFAQKRNLENQMNLVATALDDAPFDDIRKMLLEMAFFGDNTNSVGLMWDDDPKERLKRYKEPEQTYKVPTGIATLDNTLGGGLAPRELGVVLAPPNSGKSATLVSIGKGAVMAGKKVVHYTLEMSAASVQRRYDMSLLGMNKNMLRKKQGTAWKRMQEVLNSISKNSLLIKEYPMYSQSPASVKAHLDLVANRDGFIPDLVIIDYAALMQSGRKYDQMRHEVSTIYRELHGTCAERHIPIWTAHQTNREGMKISREQNVAGMESLGECFEIGAISDVIFSLNQTPDEKIRGEIRAHWAKNRENPAGHTEVLATDFSISTVKDIQDEM